MRIGTKKQRPGPEAVSTNAAGHEEASSRANIGFRARDASKTIRFDTDACLHE